MVERRSVGADSCLLGAFGKHLILYFENIVGLRLTQNQSASPAHAHVTTVAPAVSSPVKSCRRGLSNGIHEHRSNMLLRKCHSYPNRLYDPSHYIIRALLVGALVSPFARSDLVLVLVLVHAAESWCHSLFTKTRIYGCSDCVGRTLNVLGADISNRQVDELTPFSFPPFQSSSVPQCYRISLLQTLQRRTNTIHHSPPFKRLCASGPHTMTSW